MQNNMDNMSTQSVLKSIRVCLVDVVSSHVVTCMSCRLSQFSCRYVYVLSTQSVLMSLRVCLVDLVSSHVVTCMSCRLSQFSRRYVYVLSTQSVLTVIEMSVHVISSAMTTRTV